VYKQCRKKIKKFETKKREDLNDDEDVEMMEVIKKHQDHLRNLKEGVEDTNYAMLLRENDCMSKKADDL